MKSEGALFSPISIKNVTFKNRFICSPMHMHDSTDDGFPNQSLLDHYVRLAEGECGLIIPGYVFPMKTAQALLKQTGWHTDAHAEAWRSTINEIHKHGSKIAFQVCHGGLNAFPGLGFTPAGPSAIREGVRELSISEIEDIIHSFKQAAIRCKKVGADAIQVHACHGYLLSTFLSPLTNRRTDKYGGSFENRHRILSEILSEIRPLTDENFLLTLKINGEDCAEGGLQPEDVGKIVRAIPKVDLVEVSCSNGQPHYFTRSKISKKLYSKKLPKEQFDSFMATINSLDKKYAYREGYNLPAAEIIKKMNPDTIISSVGGFRKLSFMEDAVKSGKTDFISLGRPFLASQDIVKKLRTGELEESDCINCGQCIVLPWSNPPVRCFVKHP